MKRRSGHTAVKHQIRRWSRIHSWALVGNSKQLGNSEWPCYFCESRNRSRSHPRKRAAIRSETGRLIESATDHRLVEWLEFQRFPAVLYAHETSCPLHRKSNSISVRGHHHPPRPWRGGRLIPSPVAPPICIRQAAKMGEKLSGKERGGEKIVVLGGGGQTGRDQINNCTHSHPLSPRLINSLSSLMCQSIHRPVCRRPPPPLRARARR